MKLYGRALASLCAYTYMVSATGYYTGAMVDYAHQICWISNTYYLPQGVAPLTIDQPRDSVLIYYQV